MNNLSYYSLYVGNDVSKGKANATVFKVPVLRTDKPKFLWKNYLFKFIKSDVFLFLDKVRNLSDDSYSSILFALEVTGNYFVNIYKFIEQNCLSNEDVHQNQRKVLI